MLTDELIATLKNAGAALVGIGEMNGIAGKEWPLGIAVAVRLPITVVKDLVNAPTIEYGHAYGSLNAKLDSIVKAGAAFLEEKGYRAFPQTLGNVVSSGPFGTVLPHKTVATHAGLGWIGKSCLLVTPEFGSAVRISSLLTDAPLQASDPVTESRCGSCNECVQNCPAGALRDTLWKAGMPREEIADVAACDEKMNLITNSVEGLMEAVGGHAICGKCIAVCPYTRRGLSVPN